MARVSKMALFVRAFLVTLLMGVPASQVGAGDDADWNRSAAIDTSDGYFWYLRRNPAGTHISDAIEALIRLNALGDAEVPEATRQVDLY